MAQSSAEVRAALAHMRGRVVKALRAHGAYLYYSAMSGSQYVKFSDPRMGSLRIADHAGIERYRYKWNLLHGGERSTQYNGTVRREFYGFQDCEQFLVDFELAAENLEREKGKYNPERDPFKEQRTR